MMTADLEQTVKLATPILQAALKEMERQGIDVAAASLAMIAVGAEGLTELHGAAFAADQLRSHAVTVELYAATTKGEG